MFVCLVIAGVIHLRLVMRSDDSVCCSSQFVTAPVYHLKVFDIQARSICLTSSTFKLHCRLCTELSFTSITTSNHQLNQSPITNHQVNGVALKGMPQDMMLPLIQQQDDPLSLTVVRKPPRTSLVSVNSSCIIGRD